MRRSLVLKTERLTELSTVEMRAVAGGATTDCQHVSDVCIRTYDVLCFLSRAMAPCPTEPTFVCVE